jgi:hypothetical protein
MLRRADRDRRTRQSYCASVSEALNVEWASEDSIRVGGFCVRNLRSQQTTLSEVRMRRRLCCWRSSRSTLSVWPRFQSRDTGHHLARNQAFPLSVQPLARKRMKTAPSAKPVMIDSTGKAGTGPEGTPVVAVVALLSQGQL